MSSSHTRIITLALTVALLALPATPVLAAPAGGPGATATQDSDTFGLSGIWNQLTDWLASLLVRPDDPFGQDLAPGTVYERIGPGADPGGTPSNTSDVTISTVPGFESSDSDGPTG